MPEQARQRPIPVLDTQALVFEARRAALTARLVSSDLDASLPADAIQASVKEEDRRCATSKEQQPRGSRPPQRRSST
jgi:hypothetical protein